MSDDIEALFVDIQWQQRHHFLVVGAYRPDDKNEMYGAIAKKQRSINELKMLGLGDKTLYSYIRRSATDEMIIA